MNEKACPTDGIRTGCVAPCYLSISLIDGTGNIYREEKREKKREREKMIEIHNTANDVSRGSKYVMCAGKKDGQAIRVD